MFRRRALLAVTVVSLLVAPAAAAHVTVNPNEAVADGFARFAIRIPNERPSANTTKVTVRLPEGLVSVSFQPKPGWRRTIAMAKLSPPIEVFGETITERVATVTWEGGAIKPGEFDEFGMSAKVPNAAGSELVFPSLQTYSNGEVVRWIGPADADEPAPRVTLTPQQDENARTTSEPTATPAAEADDDDDGRATLALGFGIAGLIAGLAALGLTLVRKRA